MKRLLLFAAMLVWSGMAGAVVYKWVDAKGEVQYGDRPPDGVHAEVVDLLGTHVARAASSQPAAPAPAARTPGATPTAQDDADKKAIAGDVAQSKEKECTDAQDRYKKLIEGRRLFKTGPDGERQFLTSEEIDTARLDAKRDVDTACNSPT
jgi:hypothetical protein